MSRISSSDDGPAVVGPQHVQHGAFVVVLGQQQGFPPLLVGADAEAAVGAFAFAGRTLEDAAVEVGRFGVVAQGLQRSGAVALDPVVDACWGRRRSWASGKHRAPVRSRTLSGSGPGGSAGRRSVGERSGFPPGERLPAPLQQIFHIGPVREGSLEGVGRGGDEGLACLA